jgi:hypothetical protein
MGCTLRNTPNVVDIVVLWYNKMSTGLHSQLNIGPTLYTLAFASCFPVGSPTTRPVPLVWIRMGVFPIIVLLAPARTALVNSRSSASAALRMISALDASSVMRFKSECEPLTTFTPRAYRNTMLASNVRKSNFNIYLLWQECCFRFVPKRQSHGQDTLSCSPRGQRRQCIQ